MGAMDPYSFGIALASALLTALTILREHIRTRDERAASERHRAEDRGEKSRERRLDVFLAFLQHVDGVRNGVTRACFLESKITKENERFAVPELAEALREVEAEMLALGRSANMVAIMEPKRTGEEAFRLYAKLVEGMNRMGRHEWRSETELDEWNNLVQRLSGNLCTVLNEDFRAVDSNNRAKASKV